MCMRSGSRRLAKPSLTSLTSRSKRSKRLPICCRNEPGKERKSPENAARKMLKVVKSARWKKLLISRLEVRFLHGSFQITSIICRYIETAAKNVMATKWNQQEQTCACQEKIPRLRGWSG